MRPMLIAFSLVMSFHVGAVYAADEPDTTDRVLGGVISGLLGAPQGQAGSPVYVEEERERLFDLLESGEYATSRQGEPVDMIILGVPLTHMDNVYTAAPIQPSRSRYQR